MTVRDGGRIHGWWNQFRRLIQRTGMAYTRFSDMERSSENNSDLRSQLKCQGVSGGVKGQDERHRTAPWTPPLTPTPLYALTTDNVVIHGMTGTCGWCRCRKAVPRGTAFLVREPSLEDLARSAVAWTASPRRLARFP